MEYENDIILMSNAKNEGPFVLEWLAIQRLTGFKKIAVFQNNSTDMTDRMLRVMARAGLIEYYDNAFKPGATVTPYQSKSFRRMVRSESYKKSKWFVSLDFDEFLHIKVGNGKIQDLLELVEDYDAVRLNWRFFDHGGVKEFDENLLTKKFTQANDLVEYQTRMSAFKTMIKTASFGRPGIHHPRMPTVPEPKFCNGSLLKEGEGYQVKGFSSNDPGMGEYAQLFHYIIKDPESYMMKCARGRVRTNLTQIGKGYWNRYHFRGTVQETALSDRSEEIWEEMLKIDELCGGVLMQLRAKSIRLWRKQIRQVKATPEGKEFYDYLLNTMNRPAIEATPEG